MKGNHPLVEYDQNWDRVRNHQFLKGDEAEVGKTVTLLAWTEMSDTMRKHLNTPLVFNGCTPGVIDADWMVKLNSAAP